MDLRQIRYFLTVAEERNITRAADRLHISQPPLSRALMDLEEELGCTLLIRGKRHVTLTAEGLALKRRGEQILALAEITKSEIMEQCPDISQVTVQRALADLLKNEEILKIGGGRYTSYVWNGDK